VIVEETRFFAITVSFGSVASSISLPCYMSHASIPAEVTNCDLRKALDGSRARLLPCTLRSCARACATAYRVVWHAGVVMRGETPCCLSRCAVNHHPARYNIMCTCL